MFEDIDEDLDQELGQLSLGKYFGTYMWGHNHARAITRWGFLDVRDPPPPFPLGMKSNNYIKAHQLSREKLVMLFGFECLDTDNFTKC